MRKKLIQLNSFMIIVACFALLPNFLFTTIAGEIQKSECCCNYPPQYDPHDPKNKIYLVTFFNCYLLDFNPAPSKPDCVPEQTLKGDYTCAMTNTLNGETIYVGCVKKRRCDLF